MPPADEGSGGTGSGGWIDVTYPIDAAMVTWPGQPVTERTRVGSLDAGDGANVSALRMSVHSGTHMDAPLHFLPGGDDITAAPFDAMFGAVRVARVPEPMITADAVAACEERLGPLEPGDRIFFRTRNSDRDWLEAPFDEAYVAVEASGAEALVARGVRVVGVDYLSVAPFRDPATTHRTLLSAGVWVIEALDLRRVGEGRYEMAALPLKIRGSDASPLRVLLRPAGGRSAR